MTVSLLVSMSLFALAASLSPGPVNILSLSGSARYGLKVGLVFVTGATFGFIALFLFIGFSLHYLNLVLPWITQAIQWLGICFLIYLSYQLFMDNGELQVNNNGHAPSFITGTVMQWLNPKAWLASMSGISAYIPQTKPNEVLVFAGIYLPICWLSLAIWVGVGIVVGQYFQSHQKMRFMNKTLALLLAGSCFMLLV
ncbi:LysE family translocator [Paraglaciecola marina]|uniref:LysE family translocator n=1 Tax=Paraglaciecola marina TaxID=2500157 RepID=UPI00105CC6A6|nr:LysE family translocator [Paraglaciecola marina]